MKHKIEKWVRRGLLLPEQAHKIWAHEAQKRKNHIFFGVLGLGTGFIVMGLIDLIRPNWFRISHSAKLISYFSLQSTACFLFFYAFDKRGPLREGLHFLFATFFFAGIWLVADTYRLPLHTWHLLVLWLGIVFPLLFLSEGALFAYFWFAILSFAGFLWVNSDGALSSNSLYTYKFIWLTSAALLFCALGLSPELPLPTLFLKAALSVSLVFLLGVVSLVSASSYEVIYNEFRPAPSLLLLPWGGYLLCLITLVIHRRWHGRIFSVAMGLSLFVLCLFYTLPYSVNMGHQRALPCVFFILVWVLAAVAAVARSRRPLYDLATLVILGRLLYFFPEFTSRFARSPLGYIVVGVLTLISGVLWHRYRYVFSRWIEKRV